MDSLAAPPHPNPPPHGGRESEGSSARGGDGPRQPSRRSLLGLDATNFFLADVRDGLGPFLGIFLRDVRHWDAGRVGVVLAASQFVSVLAQTPVGGLIDRTRAKRAAMAVAASAVAVGSLLLYASGTFPLVVAAQSAIGLAATVFPPAIAAVTLGLVGRAAMPRRTGRNEALNHAGNVVAAALAGASSWLFGYKALFVMTALMSVASIAAILMIRARDIDHGLARGADDGPGDGREAVGLGALLKDRRIGVFIASSALFHLGNAAMLPLAGQKSSDGMAEGGAPVVMSACIVAAQLVMVPVALLASRFAASWGRKPVFLIGFAVLPVRGLLYCLSVNPFYLVAVQLLDGVGAGIFGVVSVLVVADLTRGTGRFNLTQGAVATASGVGAALSNLIAGFVVKASGFDAGFLTLAALAAAGATFFLVAMPETRPDDPASPGAAVIHPRIP